MTLRELLDHYARPEPAPMLLDDDYLTTMLAACAAKHQRRAQRLRNEANDTEPEYME